MTSSHAWLMEWFMALGLPHITCILLVSPMMICLVVSMKNNETKKTMSSTFNHRNIRRWSPVKWRAYCSGKLKAPTRTGNYFEKYLFNVSILALYIYIYSYIYIYIFECSGNGSKALGPCSSPPHLTPREEYWHSNIVIADGQMWFDICPNRLLGFFIGQGKFGLALHSCFHVVMTDCTRSWQGGWGFPKSIEMHYVNYVINVELLYIIYKMQYSII